MKKIFTLTFIIFALFANAQSSLTIFNNSGQQFFVIINGIKQNSLPLTNCRVDNLSTEMAYEVKLIFADGKTGDISKKLWFEENGNYLARVDFKKKKGKLKYFGMTPAGQPTPEATPVIYRPNDQSVYSDQNISEPVNQSAINNSNSQNQSVNNQNSGGINNNSTVNQNDHTQEQINQNSQAVPSTAQTINPDGSITTTTVYQDGSVTQSTQLSTQNSGNNQASIDPNNSVQGGININVTETGVTTFVNDPNNSNGQININMNVSGMDPNTGTNIPNQGQSGININVSGSGLNNENIDQNTNLQIGNNISTTSSSSKTVTSTQTINGQSTSTIVNTESNETFVSPQEEVSTSQPSGQNNSISYSCNQILMDAEVFATELNEMSFDSDKKELILADLENRCLSSDQAFIILETLSFDADRLEIAKFMFDRMTDRVNAKKLLELFKFDSSKMEFREYIRGK